MIAVTRPAAVHGFTKAQIDALMVPIYRRGDRLMVWFLVTHFALGLGLAFYHGTWTSTILVGSASLGGMVLMAKFLPGHFATRSMASVFQQAFVALHIYQMFGQSEQHFWFFTALTMMIVYQDWRCMWLGTVLIIAQHTAFAFMHNAGWAVHFFPEAHVDFTKLFFHFGIALVHVGICGYWAHLLRQQTLRDAWKQHELEDSDRRQRAILDNMGDLAWVKDRHGRYIAANPAMANVVGMRVDQIEGRVDAELFAPSVVATFEAEDRWVMEHREPLRVEREITTARGRQFVYESVMTPFFSPEGEVMGITGIGRDISMRKQAEAERVRLDAKVQHAQKLESLGVLAGGIAHDFNNLLAGILGNVTLVRMSLPPDAPDQEQLADAESATRRASELTSQMLAYAGKGRFAIQLLDLSRTVREMSHLLAAVVSKKASRIDRLADGLPAIEADVAQIRQVIMNLITNASDALNDNGGSITLTTGVTRPDRATLEALAPDRELPDGEYVFFKVSDTGTGMDEATLRKIFDPFFTTKFTGRGLGLAAVQGIMRSHRGAITAESEPGKGTTFTVLFPAAAGTAPTVPEPKSHDNGADRERVVLIVDDEESVRTMARTALERAGCVVDVAGDGEAALQLLAANPDRYDLVILDLTMPRMSGEEAQVEIERRFPDTPVVLSSGFSEVEAVSRFAGRGVAGYLQKPYEVDALLRTVRQCARADATAT